MVIGHNIKTDHNTMCLCWLLLSLKAYTPGSWRLMEKREWADLASSWSCASNLKGPQSNTALVLYKLSLWKKQDSLCDNLGQWKWMGSTWITCQHVLTHHTEGSAAGSQWREEYPQDVDMLLGSRLLQAACRMYRTLMIYWTSESPNLPLCLWCFLT